MQTRASSLYNDQDCDKTSETYNFQMCLHYQATGDCPCCDGLIFIGIGEGRQARSNANQHCMSSDVRYVARFDCTGGTVAEKWRETVTPSPVTIMRPA